MNRRAFLSALGAVAAGAVLDPEMLLWKPGAKTIFLPSPRKLKVFTLGPPVVSSFSITSHGWITQDIVQVWAKLSEPDKVRVAFGEGDTFTIEGVYA